MWRRQNSLDNRLVTARNEIGCSGNRSGLGLVKAKIHKKSSIIVSGMGFNLVIDEMLNGLPRPMVSIQSRQ